MLTRLIESNRYVLRVAGISTSTTLGLLALYFLTTIVEGIGLSMLLPVYQIIQSGKEAAELAQDSQMWRWLTRAYAFVGLEATVPVLLVTSFVAIVLRQIITYARLVYTSSRNFMLVRRLRERAFNSVLHARLGYVESEGLGRLVNDLTIEAQVAAECAISLVSLWGYLVVSAVYIVLLCLLSLPMTAAALVVILLAVLPVMHLLRQGRIVGQQTVEANSNLLNFVSERLRSVRLIRLSGMVAAEQQNMRRHTRQQFDRFMRGQILQARSTVMIEPIVVAAGFLFLYLGVNQFSLSLGEVGLFLVFVLRLVPVVKEFMTVRYGIANRLGSVAQIDRRLKGLDEAREHDAGTVKLASIDRDIRLDGVTYRYNPEGAPALLGVDLVIPVGKITALVGPSGSGKSTLIDLLPRLREPAEGRVLLDGRPATDFTLESVRAAISYAPQAPQIFNVSPAEHIQYGRADGGSGDLENAARLAGATDFIAALPEGYDTPLGEGGARLSGGQRQRLDLARAIYKGAPVLVLDEPTSQLDADSEHAFREALQRIRRETRTTVIVVAHRLSTVAMADQIVVLRDGRVEQTGTHSSLVAAGGWYASAFRKQQTDPDADPNGMDFETAIARTASR